jgi:hypothetical protein
MPIDLLDNFFNLHLFRVDLHFLAVFCGHVYLLAMPVREVPSYHS